MTQIILLYAVSVMAYIVDKSCDRHLGANDVDCMHSVTSSHLIPRQMHNKSNVDLIYYLRCISGHHQMRRVVYYGARNLMGETLMIRGSTFHCLHTKHYTAWICLH